MVGSGLNPICLLWHCCRRWLYQRLTDPRLHVRPPIISPRPADAEFISTARARLKQSHPNKLE